MTRTNCPNCGAPIKGVSCAYCGTMFEPPEKVLGLAIGKKVSISFEHEGRTYEFDMVLDHMGMDCDANAEVFYDWYERATYVRRAPSFAVSFDGRVVQHDADGRDVFFVVKEA